MKQAINFSAKGLKEFRTLVNREKVDASYQRIDKALNALRQIADTMYDNGYYETEESALRCQINYIEQEINYIRNN